MSASKRQLDAARSGQVIPAGDHYKTRIRFADGSRPFIHLPRGLSEDEAKARAAVLAKKAIDEGWTREKQGAAVAADPNRDLGTVSGWFEAYLEYKEARRQTIGATSSHYKNWIFPNLGHKRMNAVTPEDLRRLVALLDRAVQDDDIRWKTATNVWGTVTKAFKDATNSKNEALRILSVNPALGIPPPDKGRETQKVHLFPSEFLALMRCGEIPQARRRAYAMSIYLYLRPGELEALDWKDFDLAHGQVTIQRSVDREQGGFKAPKNGMARLPMAIEPNLIPLLTVMHREARGHGLVFGADAGTRDAQLLRDDLLRAGVERHELHHGSDKPPREWMTLHDLRTTGITWMAVRRDDLPSMQARAGHSTLEMTQHYINMAAVLRRSDYGEPFPELPHAVIGGPARASVVRPVANEPAHRAIPSRMLN